MIGACSVTPEPEKEPSIGPQLKLMELNSTEEKIMGTWTNSDGAITEHRYHATLGKQELTYDKNGVFTSCYSFEIKENFIDSNHHLVVTYFNDIPWNTFPGYIEYRILSDTSIEVAFLLTKYLPNPDIDKNGFVYFPTDPDGSPSRFPMKKIDTLDAQQEPNDIEELFVELLKNEEE